MTLDEALKAAAAGSIGSVQIDGPWLASVWDPFKGEWSPRVYSPGLVSIAYLNSLAHVRPWRPAARSET